MNDHQMRMWEQGFQLRLVDLCQRDLAQAHQDLLQAKERGDVRAAAEKEFTILSLQLQIEQFGPVVIDGSITHLALPERNT